MGNASVSAQDSPEGLNIVVSDGFGRVDGVGKVF